MHEKEQDTLELLEKQQRAAITRTSSHSSHGIASAKRTPALRIPPGYRSGKKAQVTVTEKVKAA